MQTTDETCDRAAYSDAADAAAALQHSGSYCDAEDVALMHCIARRDRQAFETLYYRYARRLTGYLAKLLWQPEQVEEVIDDVMLAIWQQAARFHPSARVSTWIFSIAHHKALTARARAARRLSILPPDTAEPCDQENPETDLAQQERLQAVATALQSLPPEQRTVVQLTYYHHCSYHEIAAIMGCPVNTVKTRMARARHHLATHLAGME
jgi:RNA polymerase sigma-70 factor (ECF subfamily)